ncbi:hypothetical protein CLV28_2867 [Sediminihabitans luteus]|uniref:LysM domain-containing protein n=1 Tax=Sediminihabitans luteus TaxID=1138585 RepID=A0A2M9CCH5_9CELL|nr:hypothetical protein CLV28_2867 [Sediminihabitans luteus]
MFSAIAIVVLALAFLGAGRAVAGDVPEPTEVRQVLVEPGQTLWGLASGVTRPGADVRDTVAYLLELNALQGAELQVGQSVLVPAGLVG